MYTEEELKKYNVKKTGHKKEYINIYQKFPKFVEEAKKIAKEWKVELDKIELEICDYYGDDSYSLYVSTEHYPRTDKEIQEALDKAKQDVKRTEEWDRQQFERLKSKFGDK